MKIKRFLITFIILTVGSSAFSDPPRLGPNGEIYIVYNVYNGDDPRNVTLFYVTDKYGFRNNQIHRDEHGKYTYPRLVNGEWIDELITVYFDSDGEPYVQRYPLYSSPAVEAFYEDLAITRDYSEDDELNDKKSGEIKRILNKYRSDEEKLNELLDQILYSAPGDDYSLLTEQSRAVRLDLVRHVFESNYFSKLPDELLRKIKWGYGADQKTIDGVLRMIPNYLLGQEDVQFIYNRGNDNFKIYLERNDLTSEDLDATLLYLFNSMISSYRFVRDNIFLEGMLNQLRRFELLIRDTRFDISKMYNLLNNPDFCEKQFARGKNSEEESNNSDDLILPNIAQSKMPCEILMELYNSFPGAIRAIINQKFSEHEEKLKSQISSDEKVDDLTPLMKAVIANDLEQVRELLAECTDSQILDLNATIENQCIGNVTTEEEIAERLEIKKKKCADIDYQEEEFEKSALIFAAESGSNEIIAFLLQKGADSNLRTKSGKSALVISAHINDLEAVESLLNRGALDFVAAKSAATAGKKTAEEEGEFEDDSVKAEVLKQYDQIIGLIDKAEQAYILYKTNQLLNLINYSGHQDIGIPALIAAP